MEILIEFLAELIIEIFSELGVYVIGRVFEANLTNSKALKLTKNIIYTIVFAIVLTLLFIAIFNKRGIIILTVIVFLILNLLIIYLKYIISSQKAKKALVIIGAILRYSFSITLIILGGLYLENGASKILLIVLSFISILIFIFIDSFRIYKNSYNKNKGR